MWTRLPTHIRGPLPKPTVCYHTVTSVGGAQGMVGTLREGCWVVLVRLQTLAREYGSLVAL